MRKKSIVKIISTLLVATFFMSEVSYAEALSPSAFLVSKSEQVTADPSNFEPPLDWANLQEIHRGSGQKLIIHIQDAHSNFSGQESLANALDFLMAKYGVELVLSEGGVEDCSLTELKKIASPETWKRVARKHLIMGNITGAEYLNLVSDHPMKIIGLEDMPLYMQSVQNYADLADKREAILSYLKKIRSELEKLKVKMYPSEFQEYEKIKTKSQGDGFEDSFKKLFEIANTEKISLEEFPNLESLVELSLKEKLIDFNLANLERAALMEELEKKGGIEDLMKEIEAMGHSKDSKMSQFAIFQKTFNIAKEKKILLTKYPNYVKYGEYLKFFSELDLEAVMNELEKAEDKVYAAVLKTGDAKLVRSIDRYTKLLMTAYNIQMTTKEFNLFRANEPDFATKAYLAFLNKKLMEQGYFDDLISYEPLLEEGKRSLEAFYDSVGQRDFAFIKNTEKALGDENQKIAVLITGGYHTSHLKKLFKEKGYSYVVLTPHVTRETNQAKYEKLLLEPVRKEVKRVEMVNGEARPSSQKVAILALKDSGSRLTAVLKDVLPPNEAAEMAGKLLGSRLAAQQEFKTHPHEDTDALLRPGAGIIAQLPDQELSGIMSSIHDLKDAFENGKTLKEVVHSLESINIQTTRALVKLLLDIKATERTKDNDAVWAMYVKKLRLEEILGWIGEAANKLHYEEKEGHLAPKNLSLIIAELEKSLHDLENQMISYVSPLDEGGMTEVSLVKIGQKKAALLIPKFETTFKTLTLQEMEVDGFADLAEKMGWYIATPRVIEDEIKRPFNRERDVPAVFQLTREVALQRLSVITRFLSYVELMEYMRNQREPGDPPSNLATIISGPPIETRKKILSAVKAMSELLQSEPNLQVVLLSPEAKLLDGYVKDKKLNMTQELLDNLLGVDRQGMTLEKAMARFGDHWSLDQKAELIQKIAEGINEYQKMGIVHRDLAPKNIWVDVDQNTGKIGKVLIFDFGLASLNQNDEGETIKRAGPEKFEATLLTQKLEKRLGSFVGTLGYMSLTDFSDLSISSIPQRDDMALRVMVYRLMGSNESWWQTVSFLNRKMMDVLPVEVLQARIRENYGTNLFLLHEEKVMKAVLEFFKMGTHPENISPEQKTHLAAGTPDIRTLPKDFNKTLDLVKALVSSTAEESDYGARLARQNEPEPPTPAIGEKAASEKLPPAKIKDIHTRVIRYYLDERRRDGENVGELMPLDGPPMGRGAVWTAYRVFTKSPDGNVIAYPNVIKVASSEKERGFRYDIASLENNEVIQALPRASRRKIIGEGAESTIRLDSGDYLVREQSEVKPSDRVINAILDPSSGTDSDKALIEALLKEEGAAQESLVADSEAWKKAAVKAVLKRELDILEKHFLKHGVYVYDPMFSNFGFIGNELVLFDSNSLIGFDRDGFKKSRWMDLDHPISHLLVFVFFQHLLTSALRLDKAGVDEERKALFKSAFDALSGEYYSAEIASKMLSSEKWPETEALFKKFITSSEEQRTEVGSSAFDKMEASFTNTSGPSQGRLADYFWQRIKSELFLRPEEETKLAEKMNSLAKELVQDFAEARGALMEENGLLEKNLTGFFLSGALDEYGKKEIGSLFFDYQKTLSADKQIAPQLPPSKGAFFFTDAEKNLFLDKLLLYAPKAMEERFKFNDVWGARLALRTLMENPTYEQVRDFLKNEAAKPIAKKRKIQLTMSKGLGNMSAGGPMWGYVWSVQEKGNNGISIEFGGERHGQKENVFNYYIAPGIREVKLIEVNTNESQDGQTVSPELRALMDKFDDLDIQKGDAVEVQWEKVNWSNAVMDPKTGLVDREKSEVIRGVYRGAFISLSMHAVDSVATVLLFDNKDNIIIHTKQEPLAHPFMNYIVGVRKLAAVPAAVQPVAAPPKPVAVPQPQMQPAIQRGLENEKYLLLLKFKKMFEPGLAGMVAKDFETFYSEFINRPETIGMADSYRIKRYLMESYIGHLRVSAPADLNKAYLAARSAEMARIGEGSADIAKPKMNDTLPVLIRKLYNTNDPASKAGSFIEMWNKELSKLPGVGKIGINTRLKEILPTLVYIKIYWDKKEHRTDLVPWHIATFGLFLEIYLKTLPGLSEADKNNPEKVWPVYRFSRESLADFFDMDWKMELANDSNWDPKRGFGESGSRLATASTAQQQISPAEIEQNLTQARDSKRQIVIETNRGVISGFVMEYTKEGEDVFRITIFDKTDRRLRSNTIDQNGYSGVKANKITLYDYVLPESLVPEKYRAAAGRTKAEPPAKAAPAVVSPPSLEPLAKVHVQAAKKSIADKLPVYFKGDFLKDITNDLETFYTTFISDAKVIAFLNKSGNHRVAERYFYDRYVEHLKESGQDGLRWDYWSERELRGIGYSSVFGPFVRVMETIHPTKRVKRADQNRPVDLIDLRASHWVNYYKDHWKEIAPVSGIETIDNETPFSRLVPTLSYLSEYFERNPRTELMLFRNLLSAFKKRNAKLKEEDYLFSQPTLPEFMDFLAKLKLVHDGSWSPKEGFGRAIVAGSRLSAEIPFVKGKDLIQVGRTQIIFWRRGNVLKVMNNKTGEYYGGEITVLRNGSFTIGREEDNQIRIPDERASRVHAKVSSDGIKFYIIDLGSTNGTLINGLPVRKDRPEELEFEWAEAPEASMDFNLAIAKAEELLEALKEHNSLLKQDLITALKYLLPPRGNDVNPEAVEFVGNDANPEAVDLVRSVLGEDASPSLISAMLASEKMQLDEIDRGIYRQRMNASLIQSLKEKAASYASPDDRNDVLSLTEAELSERIAVLDGLREQMIRRSAEIKGAQKDLEQALATVSQLYKEAKEHSALLNITFISLDEIHLINALLVLARSEKNYASAAVELLEGQTPWITFRGVREFLAKQNDLERHLGPLQAEYDRSRRITPNVPMDFRSIYQGMISNPTKMAMLAQYAALFGKGDRFILDNREIVIMGQEKGRFIYRFSGSRKPAGSFNRKDLSALTRSGSRLAAEKTIAGLEESLQSGDPVAVWADMLDLSNAAAGEQNEETKKQMAALYGKAESFMKEAIDKAEDGELMITKNSYLTVDDGIIQQHTMTFVSRNFDKDVNDLVTMNEEELRAAIKYWSFKVKVIEDYMVLTKDTAQAGEMKLKRNFIKMAQQRLKSLRQGSRLAAENGKLEDPDESAYEDVPSGLVLSSKHKLITDGYAKLPLKEKTVVGVMQAMGDGREWTAADGKPNLELVYYPFQMEKCPFGHKIRWGFRLFNPVKKQYLELGSDEIVTFRFLEAMESDGKKTVRKLKEKFRREVFRQNTDGNPFVLEYLSVLSDPEVFGKSLDRFKSSEDQAKLKAFHTMAVRPGAARTMRLFEYTVSADGKTAELTYGDLMRYAADTWQELGAGRLQKRFAQTILLTQLQYLRIEIATAVQLAHEGDFSGWDRVAERYSRYFENLATYSITASALVKSFVRIQRAGDTKIRSLAFLASGPSMQVRILQRLEPLLRLLGFSPADFIFYDFDASQAMLRQGRSSAEAKGVSAARHIQSQSDFLNSALKQQDGQPFSPNSIDLAHSGIFGTIGEESGSDGIKKKVRFLSEANRVLREGGYLLLTAKNGAFPPQLISLLEEKFGLKALNADEQELGYEDAAVKTLTSDKMQQTKLKSHLSGAHYLLLTKIRSMDYDEAALKKLSADEDSAKAMEFSDENSLLDHPLPATGPRAPPTDILMDNLNYEALSPDVIEPAPLAKPDKIAPRQNAEKAKLSEERMLQNPGTRRKLDLLQMLARFFTPEKKKLIAAYQDYFSGETDSLPDGQSASQAAQEIQKLLDLFLIGPDSFTLGKVREKIPDIDNILDKISNADVYYFGFVEGDEGVLPFLAYILKQGERRLTFSSQEIFKVLDAYQMMNAGTADALLKKVVLPLYEGQQPSSFTSEEIIKFVDDDRIVNSLARLKKNVRRFVHPSSRSAGDQTIRFGVVRPGGNFGDSGMRDQIHEAFNNNPRAVYRAVFTDMARAYEAATDENVKAFLKSRSEELIKKIVSDEQYKYRAFKLLIRLELSPEFSSSGIGYPPEMFTAPDTQSETVPTILEQNARAMASSVQEILNSGIEAIASDIDHAVPFSDLTDDENKARTERALNTVEKMMDAVKKIKATSLSQEIMKHTLYYESKVSRYNIYYHASNIRTVSRRALREKQMSGDDVALMKESLKELRKIAASLQGYLKSSKTMVSKKETDQKYGEWFIELDGQPAATGARLAANGPAMSMDPEFFDREAMRLRENLLAGTADQKISVGNIQRALRELLDLQEGTGPRTFDERVMASPEAEKFVKETVGDYAGDTRMLRELLKNLRIDTGLAHQNDYIEPKIVEARIQIRRLGRKNPANLLSGYDYDEVVELRDAYSKLVSDLRGLQGSPQQAKEIQRIIQQVDARNRLLEDVMHMWGLWGMESTPYVAAVSWAPDLKVNDEAVNAMTDSRQITVRMARLYLQKISSPNISQFLDELTERTLLKFATMGQGNNEKRYAQYKHDALNSEEFLARVKFLANKAQAGEDREMEDGTKIHVIGIEKGIVTYRVIAPGKSEIKTEARNMLEHRLEEIFPSQKIIYSMAGSRLAEGMDMQKILTDELKEVFLQMNREAGYTDFPIISIQTTEFGKFNPKELDTVRGLPKDQYIAVLLKFDAQQYTQGTYYQIYIDKAGYIADHWMSTLLNKTNSFEFILEWKVKPQIKAIHLHTIVIGRESVEGLRGKGLASGVFKNWVSALETDYPGYSVSAVALEDHNAKKPFKFVSSMMAQFFDAKRLTDEKAISWINDNVAAVDLVDRDVVYKGKVGGKPSVALPARNTGEPMQGPEAGARLASPVEYEVARKELEAKLRVLMNDPEFEVQAIRNYDASKIFSERIAEWTDPDMFKSWYEYIQLSHLSSDTVRGIVITFWDETFAPFVDISIHGETSRYSGVGAQAAYVPELKAVVLNFGGVTPIKLLAFHEFSEAMARQFREADLGSEPQKEYTIDLITLQMLARLGLKEDREAYKKVMQMRTEDTYPNMDEAQKKIAETNANIIVTKATNFAAMPPSAAGVLPYVKPAGKGVGPIVSVGISTGGAFEIQLAEISGRKVFATTLDQKGIQAAKAAVAENGLANVVTLKQQDIVNGFPDQLEDKTDLIYARLVYHYLTRKQLDEVFQNMKKAMVPGATAYIVVKSAEDYWCQEAMKKRGVERLEDLRDPETWMVNYSYPNGQSFSRQFFTEQILRDYVSRAGDFTVDEITPMNEMLYVDFARTQPDDHESALLVMRLTYAPAASPAAARLAKQQSVDELVQKFDDLYDEYLRFLSDKRAIERNKDVVRQAIKLFEQIEDSNQLNRKEVTWRAGHLNQMIIWLDEVKTDDKFKEGDAWWEEGVLAQIIKVNAGIYTVLYHGAAGRTQKEYTEAELTAKREELKKLEKPALAASRLATVSAPEADEEVANLGKLFGPVTQVSITGTADADAGTLNLLALYYLRNIKAALGIGKEEPLPVAFSVSIGGVTFERTVDGAVNLNLYDLENKKVGFINLNAELDKINKNEIGVENVELGNGKKVDVVAFEMTEAVQAFARDHRTTQRFLQSGPGQKLTGEVPYVIRQKIGGQLSAGEKQLLLGSRDLFMKLFKGNVAFEFFVVDGEPDRELSSSNLDEIKSREGVQTVLVTEYHTKKDLEGISGSAVFLSPSQAGDIYPHTAIWTAALMVCGLEFEDFKDNDLGMSLFSTLTGGHRITPDEFNAMKDVKKGADNPKVNFVELLFKPCGHISIDQIMQGARLVLASVGSAA